MADLERETTLQTLQNMINLVLVETGKSLRSCNKDSTRSLKNTNSRLSNNLPNFIENFHLALDDLETEIILSKASLSRDLESLRAKRTALKTQCIEAEKQAISMNEYNNVYISKEMDTVGTKGKVGAESLKKEKHLVNENHFNNESSNLPSQKIKSEIQIMPEAQNIQPTLILPNTKTQSISESLHSTQETKSQEATSSTLDEPVSLELSKHSLFDLPIDQNISMFSTVNLINVKPGMQDSGRGIQDYSQFHNSDLQMFDMKNNFKDSSSTGYHRNAVLGTSSNNELNMGFHEDQQISVENKNFIDFDNLSGVDSSLNDNAFNDLF